MAQFFQIIPVLLIFGASYCFCDPSEVQGENDSIPPPSTKPASPSSSFKSFTGKVTKNKVRLRLQPNLDGIILKELSCGDLFIVTGEIDDFYAVKPESTMKGYIFRSYVLDGNVEGNNVNVRSEPDINAVVLTQLHQGTSVNGILCAGNTKWLSIDLPENIRFYVAKNYITNIGDDTVLASIQSRRKQVADRLSAIETSIKNELEKPFSQIQLTSYVNDLKVIISQNHDLSDIAEYAQALIRTTQEQYLALSQGKQIAESKETPSNQIALQETTSFTASPSAHRYISFALEQQEENIVEEAIRTGKCVNKEAFYAQDRDQAEELLGQLVPYERPVKNRPGDFILVNAKTKVPVAYLYSNKVDLLSSAGQNVRLLVSSRPNHYFALPTYFVYDLQVSP